MESNSVAKTVAESAGEPRNGNELCIVEMGEYSRKQIKRMRKGEGKLLSKVEQVIQNMKDDGILASGSNTVVLVVREEVTLRSLLDGED